MLGTIMAVVEFLRKLNGEKVLFIAIIGFVYLGYKLNTVEEMLVKNEQTHIVIQDSVRSVNRTLHEHFVVQEAKQQESLDSIKARQGRVLKELARMGKVLY